MATTLIISRDPELRALAHEKAAAEKILWVDDCSGLEAALSVPITHVLVDLNVQWEQDIAGCIARCKSEAGAQSVIAFLHEHSGELAIRAHLAGADRVIPQNQLEEELGALLAGD